MESFIEVIGCFHEGNQVVGPKSLNGVPAPAQPRAIAVVWKSVVVIASIHRVCDTPLAEIGGADTPLKNYADKNRDRPEVKLLERYVDLCGD